MPTDGLEFTPLEFETRTNTLYWQAFQHIRIYSVGVWNVFARQAYDKQTLKLEFTPLEFETDKQKAKDVAEKH